MKLNIILILFILSYNSFANDNDLLSEYSLLFYDLSNIKTISYKSYFSIEHNKTMINLNVSQGVLTVTEVPYDFAVFGEGFFKIRLENDAVGWTRAGDLMIDNNGNLIANSRYSLYDNIMLPDSYIPETLKITNDGNIFVSTASRRNQANEVHAGRIILYNIPGELLVRHSDTIFIIKEDEEYEEVVSSSRIIQGALEMSNVPLLSVILRMYYILSVINEENMPNIGLKRELLKIQIERIANNLIDTQYIYLSGILPYLEYNR